MNVNKDVANKKWTICLNDIKNQIDNGGLTNLNAITKKHKTGNGLATMLLRNNIVFKNNIGVYQWNKNVLINNKLISAYREFQKTERNKSVNKTKIEFNMPSSPRVKKPKTRTKIVKVQEPVNNTNQAKEYGLIRRFLKWIY